MILPVGQKRRSAPETMELYFAEALLGRTLIRA